jgi:hypothetical protein
VTDYEAAFPGDFPSALKDFALRINDGNLYGARPKASSVLGVTKKTLDNWMDGVACPYEITFRRLMTCIVADPERKKARQPKPPGNG